MNAYECYGELLSDGHLKIPDEVIKKIHPNSKIKLVIMIDENEKQMQLSALAGISGLLSDLDEKEAFLFDDIIKNKFSIKNRTADL
jgi:hypothetical protein